ncbi:hypothetical protein L6164_031666 [Bauhinia variegata]|uniref:Uncharacterized protein n=1 Tax=Bauhinia variegata TaxID=167791 RepID=A0ACB9LGC9_BAUVA|nr:hypothetical protein L6164_031666 [Bauhinia variegata]
MSSIQISSDVLLTNEGAFVHNIAWIPPIDESWKLNFFAHFKPAYTSSSTDMFSCACILRDQIGFFQAACAKPLKLCDDFLVAELKALKKGLKLALKEAVDYLEIEGNVEILCNFLAGNFALFPFSAKAIAKRCFDLMLYFRGINVRQAQFLIMLLESSLLKPSIQKNPAIGKRK